MVGRVCGWIDEWKNFKIGEIMNEWMYGFLDRQIRFGNTIDRSMDV